MRALTLWRPWTDAILNGGKRVENRKRPPPSKMIGETIALHAGKRYGIGGWSTADWTPPDDATCPQGIVGVARLVGYLDMRKDARRSETCFFIPSEERGELASRVHYLDRDPWWSGPVGWLLDQVVAIEPVACRGAQGLWAVPEPQLSVVLERLKEKSA